MTKASKVLKLLEEEGTAAQLGTVPNASVVNKEDKGYGFCPTCGEPGVSRERRIDGFAECENGHKFK